jgi:hypothetical protein
MPQQEDSDHRSSLGQKIAMAKINQIPMPVEIFTDLAAYDQLAALFTHCQ